MISVVIRRYLSKDYWDVLQIDKEAFSPSNAAYDVYLYLKYGSVIFVAEINRKVVGYVTVMETEEGNAKIMSIAVKKEYRGLGIGSKLLDEAIRWCKTRGKRKVLLEVRTSNFVAQELYKKKGFKIIGVTPNYYSDGEDAYIMALNFEGQ
ncbi:MAG: ribosomal-protein-alanine N-acetyltransferase [Archaeoglobus sp.]|jgi:ribosomal-protein-alanine N-acetyltransferase|nr:MAG: ribosomal-protein-alanine N-acetyltransferase [Archaeoglobus sp.]